MSFPWDISYSCKMIGVSGQDEEQVGQPVKEEDIGSLDFFTCCESYHESFRSAANGTAYMQLRGETVTAGKNEKADGFQFLFDHVYGVFKMRDMLPLDPLQVRVPGTERRSEISSKDEQISLHGFQAGPNLFIVVPGECKPDTGIQFIHSAVCFNP
jgi:hypothetical protein